MMKKKACVCDVSLGRTLMKQQYNVTLGRLKKEERGRDFRASLFIRERVPPPRPPVCVAPPPAKSCLLHAAAAFRCC